jgi:hypothetical protein
MAAAVVARRERQFHEVLHVRLRRRCRAVEGARIVPTPRCVILHGYRGLLCHLAQRNASTRPAAGAVEPGPKLRLPEYARDPAETFIDRGATPRTSPVV